MYENTEPWGKSVPPDLHAAVKHLRNSFDRVHWGCSHTTESFCFAVLHGKQVDDPAQEYLNYLTHMKLQAGAGATQRFGDLIKQRTPSALFRAFWDLYLNALTVEVLRIFQELIQAGRANRDKLSVPYLEWAEDQVKHLIRSDRHVASLWVQNVCDKQPFDPTEDPDENIYWRKWKVPNFLVMKPSRYQPFDPLAAWNRNDAETSLRWLDSFADHYVRHLEGQLSQAAGEAALALAKAAPSPQDREQRPLPVDAAVSLAKHRTKSEGRIAETQAKHKRWRKQYRELKQGHPGMSDVWYSQKIAKLDPEGHSADTIRKNMKR